VFAPAQREPPTPEVPDREPEVVPGDGREYRHGVQHEDVELTGAGVDAIESNSPDQFLLLRPGRLTAPLPVDAASGGTHRWAGRVVPDSSGGLGRFVRAGEGTGGGWGVLAGVAFGGGGGGDVAGVGAAGAEHQEQAGDGDGSARDARRGIGVWPKGGYRLLPSVTVCRRRLVRRLCGISGMRAFSAFLRPWIRLQGVPTSPSAPLYRMIERHDDG
jgi:hypothetical protein